MGICGGIITCCRFVSIPRTCLTCAACGIGCSVVLILKGDRNGVASYSSVCANRCKVAVVEF